MNKEVKKAIKEANKKHSIRNWWNKNYYKVWRIILFPIWIVKLTYNKINKILNNKILWSEKRANEILNYYIPRCSEWSEEDNAFFFYDNGIGWHSKITKKYLKLKDRRFWNKFGRNLDNIRTYLINNFELDGFQKIVHDYKYGKTNIEFKKIEN